MNTVKTTLFPKSKNRSVYFDVEEGIRIFEEETGEPISEATARIVREYAPIINQAYNDGVRDCETAAKKFAVRISPSEAVQLRKEHSAEELGWAKEMAGFYCARPLKADETDFYTFVADVFHAGRISGVREERARRAKV